jgi:hypothetical protein
MRSEDPEPDFVCEDLGAVTEILFGKYYFALTRRIWPGKMVLRGVNRLSRSRVERSIWCFWAMI